MGYFKRQEIERMENERLQERSDNFHKKLSEAMSKSTACTTEAREREFLNLYINQVKQEERDEQMRLMARKFLVALCDARFEYRNFKIVDDAFGKFSEEDWEEFKKFVQFAL